MEGFGVLLIAVDEYPDPPGRLPSSDSANRLATMLAGERGGTVIQSVIATTQDQVLRAFETWAPDDLRPSSTIVYLVGHGSDNSVRHHFLVPDAGRTREIPTDSLATFFEKDWERRKADLGSWTLFVLDCCGAEVGVSNLTTRLTQTAVTRPRRLSLWPVAPAGAIRAGAFVDAFEAALSTFTENDAAIGLNELFLRMRSELGDIDVYFLPSSAALRNPLRAPAPLVIPLDVHAELRRVIAGLPDDVRNHFLGKAQGAESGELAWYFEGRAREIAQLCAWLHDAISGMRVVTGPAGSGKSALLGHLAVLADERLVDAYAATGLAPRLRERPRPPSSVFDATIHLTGKMVVDVMGAVLDQVLAPLAQKSRDAESVPSVGSPRRASPSLHSLLDSLRTLDRPVTVLADALDEAQEPVAIATVLRTLARSGIARVLVGTRRSRAEGPDLPADPGRRDLLDALDVHDDELVEVENDPGAIRSYVVRRLGAAESRYAGDDRTIALLADRIAARKQPFLFARLATSELLARPRMPPDAPELELLDAGHAGVFSAAVSRIGSADPVAAAMLRALSLARGRGLPESGGTWIAVARAISNGLPIPDTAVRTTIQAAAPYITLDAEAGQSSYRLAHQTFVEHYRNAHPFAAFNFDEERTVAAALLTVVERSGGWDHANYYCVRYLPSHLESGMDLEGLARLTTNPHWLAQAIQVLGVDRTIDSISGGGPCLSPIAAVVQKALRRARVALGRSPYELAGQITARLQFEVDPRLSELGDALAGESPRSSLLMRHGVLDWRSDLETTYGLVGKVRALAFGRVDDRTVLAIGVDDQVHLWDLLLGAGDRKVIANDGRRVTALAFGRIEGRNAIVIASAYDQCAVIRDVSTGAQIGEPFPLDTYVDSLAVGWLDRQLVIVASGNGRILAWNAESRNPLAVIPPPPAANVRAVAEMDGRVVAYVARSVSWEADAAAVVDLATGADVWPEPMHLDGKLGLVAGCVTRNGYIVTGVIGDDVVTFSPKERRELHRLVGKSLFNVPIKSLAVTDLDDAWWSKTTVLAIGPDYESTTLVQLCEIGDAASAEAPSATVTKRQWRGPEICSVFTLPDGRIAGLTDGPVAVWDVIAGEPIDERTVHLDSSTLTLAITGRTDTAATFVIEGRSGGEVLVAAPEDSPVASADDDAPFRLGEPRRWPRTTTAWGFVGDTPVVATGSVGGAVWIWDPSTSRAIAGPLTAVDPLVLAGGRRRLITKTASQGWVSSVAVGRHPHKGDMVAVASDGRVRLIALPSGEEVTTPTARATVIRAVALGRIFDDAVLVTGSMGGVLIVWNLGTGERVASLTLDRQIDRVWVVHGANAVAAQAAQEIYVLDVVPGGEERDLLLARERSDN